MDLVKTNSTLIQHLIYQALSVTLNTPEVVNRTFPSHSQHHNGTVNTTSSVSYAANNTMGDNSSQIMDKMSTASTTISSLITTAASRISTDVSIDPVSQSSDSSILAKITALLVITAVVLVVSYRFVVRLFLGYTADSKDDVFPDGFTDDDDSGIFKRDFDYDDY